ncbi:contractile injection system protein, VgrG/Pvc8 family [Cupriavidus oxalaticus]|uniref:Phage late control D family protein n=1 Tax=Cupriavidus oxalaticus TaxID=96344 RepID=A0A976BG98_9BURK|nr:phage late control D family protein [Cupriavidus oxalaticus]QRQ84179.1 phage late control D family protein [Cupriavidus oxalaticus]QRQ91732.1 phage late control D family protein [Cupriavidus oxalaticus]WQD86317.1 phage late control D family protein [Cupriavidus oxalaticus]SPC17883.1 hypothetical protein CO2235_MP10226 [Cupriavidus oxalaticus]
MGVRDLPFHASRAVMVKGTGLPVVLGQSALNISRLTGRDGINTLFAYEIELKTPDNRHACFGPEANLDLQAMQGKELTVEIELEGTGTGLAGNVGAGTREITGIVHEVQGPFIVGRHALYRFTLRPWLWLATLTTDYKTLPPRRCGLPVPTLPTSRRLRAAWTARRGRRSALSF